ncbi:hypothetical protein LJR118_006564 [Acidovorax sp. LjRoot118]|uniref:hypothetical protein n=1 Tax=Acidovorax sp. LjRoot118 TaxID=3342256 RepID=UPI003ECCE303
MKFSIRFEAPHKRIVSAPMLVLPLLALTACQTPLERDERQKAAVCKRQVEWAMQKIAAHGHDKPSLFVDSYEAAVHASRVPLHQRYVSVVSDLAAALAEPPTRLPEARGHIANKELCNSAGDVAIDNPTHPDIRLWESKRSAERATAVQALRTTALEKWDSTIRDDAQQRLSELMQASTSIKTTNSNGVKVDQFILKRGGVISCTTTVPDNSAPVFKCDGKL